MKIDKRWKGYYRHATTPEEYLIPRLKNYGIQGVCWEITTTCDKDGYGQCHYVRVAKDAGVTRTHQLAYVAWVGPINKGQIICHTCDNPACCNPSHLFAGTWNDNVQDMVAKGRHRSPYSKGYYKKVSPEIKAKIIKLHKKKTCFEVAAQYGISFSRVCQIWRESRHGEDSTK